MSSGRKSGLAAFVWTALAPALATGAPATEAEREPAAVVSPSERTPQRAVINGVVKDSTTGEPIEGALVILQCTCLGQAHERTTSARGVYGFTDLPGGSYTIQVLAAKADVSKIVQLPRGARFRANFSVTPDADQVIEIVVESSPVASDASASMTISMAEAQNLPIGADTSRDFTAVVDLAPTATRDAAGISLAGTTGAETRYTLDGATVTNPSFGTVGTTLIQEFVREVEIKESGYEAEYGGAVGGQVIARRVAGTNTVRGEVGARFTPRLASPRFTTATDEALRVNQVGDFAAQAYAIVSGPIVRDRLFFTIGLTPSGSRYSLIQSFYARFDRDNSGGFEGCPYKNGTNDCAPGTNYIETKKFAEQRFRTGGLSLGYIVGLDWAINPRHHLGVTAQGGPSFTRTSYRMPFSTDPNAFGTNLSASPLTGASRVATGVVNDHFGWDLAHTTVLALNYQGRALSDRVEIDAGVSLYQSFRQDAWRLDNPNQREVPSTQWSDASGRNLYEFLDRVGEVNLVPGVHEACNKPGPGSDCPTRTWLGGGIGEYDRDLSRRVAGRLNLTHFFNAAGSHQLKWGGEVSWLQRHGVYTYSGSNPPDFYANCEAGELGGGEYCYDPDEDSYRITRALRVNNHRFVFVDPDKPERHITRGFGSVRSEQGNLLANEARVDGYDETLSTINYALFLQDRWAVLSNLYLGLGVRWEMQDMRDIYGKTQIMIWDNVGPRLSAVYDWTDEGRSRLYASYGWFFQPLPLQLNSRVFGGLVSVFGSYKGVDCHGRSTTVDGVSHPRVDDDGQPTEWCVDSVGASGGTSLGAVAPRLRGQFNKQFQFGYEHEVIEDLVIGIRWLHTDLGRAVEDISPNKGLSFIVANPGVGVRQSDIDAKQSECESLLERYETFHPDDDDRHSVFREYNRCQFLVFAYDKINQQFAPPTRNYDAWTLHLQKRFADSWMLIASYTYSRLVGNYDGYVDPLTGAINLGASTQYDLPELVRNSYGPLSTNIPHRLKLDAFYTFKLGRGGRATLGSSLRTQSGLPISLRTDTSSIPYRGTFLIYALPRGAGGRLPPSVQWNLSVGYAYPLARDFEIELNARVLNVTNAKAILRIDEIYSFQPTRPIAGGGHVELKHAKVWTLASDGEEFFGEEIIQPQGNYGVPITFQQPLSGQLELELRF